VLKKNSQRKIIIFIDDLDRCSPKKTLEVLESVKVFLGIMGFVYIIGLSYEAISKLISAEYEKSGIRGEHYIKKIIQIPIMIPEWNSQDISGLIENVLSKKLDKQYSDIIIQNKDLISTAVESNPREVKGFINNFIVANEIFLGNKVQPTELLVVQALRLGWNTFYRYLSSSEQFREVIKLSLTLPYNDRIKLFNAEQFENDKEQLTEEISVLQKEVERLQEDMRKYLGKIDYELWNFLDKQKITIFGIEDWEVYRHAIESSNDIHYTYKEFHNGYLAGAGQGQKDVDAFKEGRIPGISLDMVPPCPAPLNVEFCKGWKQGYIDQISRED
jgi:predicted KAP-like P-loop ATPase